MTRGLSVSVSPLLPVCVLVRTPILRLLVGARGQDHGQRPGFWLCEGQGSCQARPSAGQV